MNLQNEINKIIKLYQKGQFQEAKIITLKLIKNNKNVAFLYNLLGAINLSLNDLNTAKLNYKKATEIDPNFSEAFCNLGTVLIDLNLLEQAKINLSKAIQMNPKLIEAHISLGKLESKYRNYKQEISCYLKALEINHESDIANNNLAAVYITIGNLEEAKKILNKVIKINPKSYKAYNNLGGILLAEGDRAKAVEYFRKAIDLNSKYAEAFRTLTENMKFEVGNKLILQMEDIYNSKSTNINNKMHISFALGKVFNDIKDYSQSFYYYKNGNKIRKDLLKYEVEYDRKKFEFIKSNLKNLEGLNKNDNSTLSKTPIFILGMPRSGTTLTEQIIASHSKVYGGGELTLVEESLVELDWKKKIVDKKFIKNFRELYSEKLCSIKTNKTLISDKMPGNFLWIGIILASMPEVKIIHTKRNTQATMWSIFKSYFTSDGNGYAYNLDDIYEYYKMYEELMQLWHIQYPKQIYVLDYEKLTSNQEKITREVINFIGLDWEDECLEFYKTRRFAHTASASQVRQKMYQGSSDEWIKYQPFLPDYF